MLILTPYGQAINVQHVVRLYIQADRDLNGEDADAPHDRYHLMVQLSNRSCIVAAASLEEKLVYALFKEVVRYWVQGRSYCDIAALLKRLPCGEPAENGHKEVCL